MIVPLPSMTSACRIRWVARVSRSRRVTRQEVGSPLMRSNCHGTRTSQVLGREDFGCVRSRLFFLLLGVGQFLTPACSSCPRTPKCLHGSKSSEVSRGVPLSPCALDVVCCVRVLHALRGCLMRAVFVCVLCAMCVCVARLVLSVPVACVCVCVCVVSLRCVSVSCVCAECLRYVSVGSVRCLSLRCVSALSLCCDGVVVGQRQSVCFSKTPLPVRCSSLWWWCWFWRALSHVRGTSRHKDVLHLIREANRHWPFTCVQGQNPDGPCVHLVPARKTS